MTIETISAAEFNELQRVKIPSKYRNKRVIVDGIAFDSIAEGKHYVELKLREREGEIEGLVLQPAFDLVVNGVKIGQYRADFQYWDNIEQRRVVADVKGVATPVYRLKRKLMKAIHDIDITEVTA